MFTCINNRKVFYFVLRRVFFFSIYLICLLLFSNCTRDRIEVDDGISEEIKPVIDKYLELSSGITNGESFLFFTDPHLLGSDNRFDQDIRNQLVSSFGLAKQLFEALPLSFCLCGGDWLNSGDTQGRAKEKLLFADAQMKKFFSPYYKMMGNHDTNYQGVVSDRDSSRGDLSRQFIDNEYFSETGSAYYTINGKCSELFVLDSGLDWDTSLNEYRVSQLYWLGSELKKSTSAHKIVGIHMFYNDVPDITPLAEELVALIEAFNTRGKYIIMDNEYDFSESSGTIHFVITGHCHVDFIEYFKGIPIIGTCKFINKSNPFDLLILNYNNGIVDLIRVGDGESRRVHMSM